MSDSLPAGGDTPTATHTTRTRRMAEMAAVVSAATALAALLFGLFGPTGAGASRTPGAGPGVSTSPSPEPAETPSASPTATATGTPSSGPTPTPTAAPTPVEPSPPLPAGWRRVDAVALTASLAVPDGWKIKDDDALHVNWVSPDGRYVIGLKRDSTYGSTAQAASIGELAWYRKTAESKMLDLAHTAGPLEQGGKSAVRLDLDFRWEGESVPAHRIDLFVAGEQGQVYALLVEDKHVAGASALPGLFETARTHLRTDVR
ncbi:hypothetical protein [Streptomyces sp. NPDC059979]|uniref:hypothetical protein n=1 Tax=Streptomyces sp. NPDC059979 TaxID=3347021 RepID=UPI0036B56A02